MYAVCLSGERGSADSRAGPEGGRIGWKRRAARPKECASERGILLVVKAKKSKRGLWGVVRNGSKPKERNGPKGVTGSERGWRQQG